MNFLKVTGLPISKLKEQYLVLILQSKAEFEQLLLGSKQPIFVDDQKAYSINGKNCFVFFHNGSGFVNEWVNGYEGH